MPPLPGLRTPLLVALESELRYAPPAALLRQLANAEALALQLDAELAATSTTDPHPGPSAIAPPQNLPNDYVVFRITGYRPDDPATTLATTPARDILGDLSALCERLSHHARLRAADIRDPFVDAPTLQQRWSLSRKSVDRLRSQGLTARRALDDRGRSRLVFMSAVVEAFERLHGSRLAQAGAFHRLEHAELASAVERARHLMQSRSLSVSAAAAVVAEETGRSHEGVRQALLRAGRANPGLLGRPIPPPAFRRRVCLRAWQRAIPAAQVAQRFGRSLAGVQRALIAERVALLRSLTWPAWLDAASEAPNAARPRSSRALATLAADQPASADDPRRGVIPPDESTAGLADAGAILQHIRASTPPSLARERALWQAHASLLARTHAVVQQLADPWPRAEAIDLAETLLRAAARIRAAMLADVLPVALATLEQRAQSSIDDWPLATALQLIGQIVDTSAAVVARHDATRGARLAAAVTVAITKIPIPQPPDGAHGGGRAARRLPAGTPLEWWAAHVAPWQRWLEPDLRARLAVATLRTTEPRSAEILALRLGLTGHLPRTIEETSRQLGVPPRTFPEIERRALRQALELGRSLLPHPPRAWPLPWRLVALADRPAARPKA